MAMTSPFSGSTDLGKLIKGSTVKMSIDSSVWTGSVIGSKYNRSLILTIAHEFMRAGEWMTEEEIQEKVRVQFLGDPIPYPCRVLRYLETSDMLLLAVDGKSTDFKLMFPPKLVNRELLIESELLGSRGHPKGAEEWTFVEGNVATPRLVNNRVPDPVFKLYEKDLIYFELRADMCVGYSGAPLVNLGGFLVGMLTGGMTHTHYALGTGPYDKLARDKEEKIREDTRERTLKNMILREEKLDAYTVPTYGLRYGRRDIAKIVVPASDINYIIHADYLEQMLRSGDPHYAQDLSLEDIYLA